MGKQLLPAKDFDEMTKQFKYKFQKTDKRSEKIKLFAMIPQNWSIQKTAAVFNTSYFIVRRAIHLVKEKGIMRDPDPKLGQSLSSETVQLVEAFYLSDEISRMVPGRIDCLHPCSW